MNPSIARPPFPCRQIGDFSVIALSDGTLSDGLDLLRASLPDRSPRLRLDKPDPAA